MATSQGRFEREVLVRAGPLIGATTLALTAAFLGVVGIVSGSATGIVGRLPLYVLAGSVGFVAALLTAEHSEYYGREALVSAAVVGVVGFVMIGLGTEGVVYGMTNPDAAVASHLSVYLLSAAMIASGLGYWTVRNWHDVSRAVQTSGL
ncbi:MAG: hypothetical protein ABEJ26_01395 [Halosimplex sp.]